MSASTTTQFPYRVRFTSRRRHRSNIQHLFTLRYGLTVGLTALGSATTSPTNRTSLRPSATTTSPGVPLRGILKNGNSASSNTGPSHYREHSMSEALMESGW